MCGRCACTLNPDILSNACTYSNLNNEIYKVPWVENGLHYKPSCNIAPNNVLPCIIAGQHLKNKNERILCPMLWGFIPPWQQGDYKKRKISTHNARIENIALSTLYSPALKNGQRCIVLCEGFYEWHNNKDSKLSKQPFFIYESQENNIKIDNDQQKTNEFGAIEIKLLKMGGIFNIHETSEGEVIYSMAVITREADEKFLSLHQRMPLIFNNDEDIKFWLDMSIPATIIMNKINGKTLSKNVLTWHPVSTLVNNVQNKSEDCKKRVKIKKEKINNQGIFMTSWLKKGSTETMKRKTDDNENKVKEKILKEK